MTLKCNGQAGGRMSWVQSVYRQNRHIWPNPDAFCVKGEVMRRVARMLVLASGVWIAATASSMATADPGQPGPGTAQAVQPLDAQRAAWPSPYGGCSMEARNKG